MIYNYLKIAWRNLLKNKTFSAINIFGLSTGIAAFLLIVNFLRFEYSYDDFHQNKGRLFRVPMEVIETDGKRQTFAFTYPAVAPALKKDFPEIEEAVRLRRRWGIVSYSEQRIPEEGQIFSVDPAIFRIFSFSFQKGNSATALTGLSDAVITESTAKKYFGDDDPIGKALRYNNEDYTVKAVLHNIPANSHLQFNILLNYEKYVQEVRANGGDAEGSWRWSDFYTYVLLKPGTDVKNLEDKLPSFAERHAGDDMKRSGYKLAFALQPIKDIHLRSKYDYEMAGNGNLTYLKYLAIAAIFILFIAWINYVNLSTAKSLDRSKEVGIRKVVGASRLQLIRQFLSESFLINLFAFLLGIAIFLVVLPYFATLVERDLNDLQDIGWKFWSIIIGLFIGGTLLAAAYPAFVLSSFRPIQSLKSSPVFSGFKSGKNVLRKSLVVLQFIAAIVLIAGAIGYYRQLKYMSSRDLGININQTLVLQQSQQTDSSQIPAVQSFINGLKANPAIASVSNSTGVPGGELGNSSGFRLINSEANKRCRTIGVDDHFIDNYGLTIVAGRKFEKDQPPADTSQVLNVILNETAAKVLGFNNPPDILNQYLRGAGYTCKVIGVLKDYHQESLQHDFDPTVFYPGGEFGGLYSLKVNTQDMPRLLAFAEKQWKASFPESPFRYFFLDDRFSAQYNAERLFSTVLWLFTLLAIIIAGLGLFGLSLYTISKRSREISIRKVLGATIMQITSLITKDYLRLIIYAAFIAIPVAWFILNNWLQDYAFRITIGWWFFLLPLVLIIGIALLTVLYQSLKAAIANPMKSLRSE